MARQPCRIPTRRLPRARASIVKIEGTAPSCSRRIEGSGFVFARHHVLTNAHVVAGVAPGPEVMTTHGRALHARVVLYDPRRDVAVLYVPDLHARPLSFAEPAQSGENAIVAGYPLNRSFTANAARIGGTEAARSPDIYQNTQVTREIYSIKAQVRPGNSGGPLLDSGGRVIGVTTAILSPSGTNAGIGFAIPVDVVNKVGPQLIRNGRVPTPGIGIVTAHGGASARFVV